MQSNIGGKGEFSGEAMHMLTLRNKTRPFVESYVKTALDVVLFK
jgi:hypothetical protein